MDEVLAFVPAGASKVPAAAFTSTRGRRIRRKDPRRFDRDRLARTRADYRSGWRRSSAGSRVRLLLGKDGTPVLAWWRFLPPHQYAPLTGGVAGIPGVCAHATVRLVSRP
jgi:hypothetical protein